MLPLVCETISKGIQRFMNIDCSLYIQTHHIQDTLYGRKAPANLISWFRNVVLTEHNSDLSQQKVFKLFLSSLSVVSL